LLNVPPALRKDNKTLNLTTVLLLSTITLLAAVLKDVSFVLAFGGATLGNLLTFVYPALMWRATVKKYHLKGEGRGIALANTAAFLGIVLGAIGAKMAIDKLF
jgi:hypothetical protein